MTKKSQAHLDRDAAAASAQADKNTDLVEEIMNKNGHYQNNNSFAEIRTVHQNLLESIVTMQQKIAEELEVPGLMLCIDPAEAKRVELSISGLASDFVAFHNDLKAVAARYADKGDKATNQDEVFLTMALQEDYILFATRMSSVIQPTYTYLTVQIGIAHQKLDGILKNMAAKQAAEQAAADAANPNVITDVEAKAV